MKQCVFLTMESLENFSSYDEAVIEPLNRLGWKVHFIPWRNPHVDWNRYDLVIIRSTWDYQQSPEHFLRVLEDIEQSKACLENTLKVVQWNINKRYLHDLIQWGAHVVPTLFPDEINEKLLLSFYDRFDTDEIIIKPLISANADNTFRIRKTSLHDLTGTLNAIFKERNYLVQPFMPNILKEGEYSLMFFGGKYSHALLKKPKPGDFRVQEEHGGILHSINADSSLINSAQEVMNVMEETPLYARVDLVRNAEDKFVVMEVELIEPSLYFNMDPNSAERFARVVDGWITST